ncbi:MAG TPA: DUF4440 domain-containing protein [Gemmatales bacterium]|nr:DUF4440 domain-containing protein [Gemmatales bacterium]
MSHDLDASKQILQLTQKLLDAIASKDWGTYHQLTDESISCFEPEACGNLVHGLPFHNFYFQLGGGSRPGNTTITQPHIRLLGEVAIVSYVRLIQSVGDAGPQTSDFEETRIWQKQGESWKQVHLHRSAIGTAR